MARRALWARGGLQGALWGLSGRNKAAGQPAFQAASGWPWNEPWNDKTEKAVAFEALQAAVAADGITDSAMLSCRPPAEEASGSGEGAGGKGEAVVGKDGTAKEPEKPAAQSNEERQAAANAAQKEALLSALGKLTVRGSVQQSSMHLLEASSTVI